MTGKTQEKNDSQLDASKIRSKVLADKLVDSTKDVDHMRTLFNDHNFKKLMEAKPNLITKRMVKSTAKVFKELEDASK
ncbi:MAG: hypothetical protein PF444_08505 [Bacteroidales bacterium]|nr:hypothetical protein [Bacteroidales bacterium]